MRNEKTQFRTGVPRKAPILIAGPLLQVARKCVGMRTPPAMLVFGMLVLLAIDGAGADPLSQWTQRFPYFQTESLTAVTYGGGQFVAVGWNGTIISSPDGYVWTDRSSHVFPNLQGVAHADGQYAAVGDGGIILISSNAAAWTQVPSVTTNTLHGIAGNPSWRAEGVPQFLAVGDSGTAVVCSNSTAWSVAPSGTSSALNGVVKSGALDLLNCRRRGDCHVAVAKRI